MAQFDVHPLTQPDICVIDVQSDLLSDLHSRAVIPLRLYDKTRPQNLGRLKPILTILDKDYVLFTTEIGYLKTKHLKPAIANLEDQRATIIQAIDFLIHGF